MPANQEGPETILLASHAADGLMQPHDATPKVYTKAKGSDNKSKRKTWSGGGSTVPSYMKYHKSTTKRRVLKVLLMTHDC